jgi:glycosyltransferase involved in cell wall biosynthesis
METVDRHKRIKLTYLITDLRVGGVPLHLLRLATRLDPAEFNIKVISLADEGPVGKRLRAAGISVKACGARTARDWRALGRLWRHLLDDPPDVLHSLLFHANIAARLVAPLAGVPTSRILCEIQTVEVDQTWHLTVDGLTCRLCRFEIANSPSVLEHLHEKARIPRTRLRCEWGAVDTQAIGAALPVDRATLGVTPGEKLVLWTGRLDPVKGFEEMLAACRKVARTLPFKLVMVGDGPYRPTVERLIGENGLRGRVVLLGQRADVPSLLRTADVFVFCSRTEGLPNSVLEAMAAGLPIVATDVPGNRDLIRDGETGLLVQRESAESIAQGVQSLLVDRDRATALGRCAQLWAIERMDIKVWARRWARLYREVLTFNS